MGSSAACPRHSARACGKDDALSVRPHTGTHSGSSILPSADLFSQDCPGWKFYLISSSSERTWRVKVSVSTKVEPSCPGLGRCLGTLGGGLHSAVEN